MLTTFPEDPPARVVIGVTRMPIGTPVEMTALAVRDLALKEVIELSSLKPLGHASSAVAVANKVFLSAVNGQTLSEAEAGLTLALNEAGIGANLEGELQKHGTELSHAVVCNIYLDDLDEFKLMNDTFATFFSGLPPTRTTVQPFPSSDRTSGDAALIRI